MIFKINKMIIRVIKSHKLNKYYLMIYKTKVYLLIMNKTMLIKRSLTKHRRKRLFNNNKDRKENKERTK